MSQQAAMLWMAVFVIVGMSIVYGVIWGLAVSFFYGIDWSAIEMLRAGFITTLILSIVNGVRRGIR